jgi:phosphoribosylformylglycinamidine synthase
VCVALMEEVLHQTPAGFVRPGDVILLLGHWVDPEAPFRDLAGSAYLRHQSFSDPGTPAPIDSEAAAVLCAVVRGLVHESVLQSAMACGRGGLAYCLAECCRSSVQDPATGAPLGARVELLQPSTGETPGDGNAESEVPAPAPRLDVLLFGEAPHRVVVSVASIDAGRVLKQCRIMGVPAVRLGTVGGDALVLQAGDQEFRVPVATSETVGSTPSTVSPP